MTPWSIPLAPVGDTRSAYETAAGYVNPNTTPLRSSTGKAQRGSLMIVYNAKMIVNVKNIIENMCM